MAKARRTFTNEFKIAAVQLVTGKGYSFAEAAHRTLIEYWRDGG